MQEDTPAAPKRARPLLFMTPQAQFELFQHRHRLHLLTQLTEPSPDGKPAEFYVRPEDLNHCFCSLSDDVDAMIEEMTFQPEELVEDAPTNV